MVALEVDAPLPSGIALESLHDPKLSITGQGPQGNCLCIYCPINECGGVYWFENKIWFLVSPVEPTFFISSLEANGVTMLDQATFEAWRAEVLSYAGDRDPPRWQRKN